MDTNIETTTKNNNYEDLYKTDFEHYIGHLVMIGDITAEQAYIELERPPEAA